MKKDMKIIAMIPARYEASRFPGKLMKDLGGKTVIRRTYEAAKNSQLFDEVYVVTDSDVIFKDIEKHGGIAIKSQKTHECGSDRIAEAVEHIDADIVVNVQGDEPFINEKALSKLIEVFENDTDEIIDLASLKTPLTDAKSIQNPNNVKVITDLNNHAIYFSRSPIPFHRDQNIDVKYYKHVGIYAFRKQALMDFYHRPMTPLEAAEKIECIRHLEHGKIIKMVETDQVSIGIDTPEDLEQALKFYQGRS
ncbi:MAG: 3-deoxy-manno-octulosonate cytidylyltransferase [Psychroflexus sp.]